MSLKPFCFLGKCIGYVLIASLNTAMLHLGIPPPTQLTLQKIGVPVAFKASYKTLSFNIYI